MLSYLYGLATDEKSGLLALIVKFFLYLLSLFYGITVRALRLLKKIRPRYLGAKVISVGNITLGGTGKTPLVEYIAKYLKDSGHKVAILSRGYKKSSKFKVQNSKFNYQTMGDEPFMLSKILNDIPVIVDRNRIRAARQAIKDFSLDTIILDDGFQQYKIKKDLDIVTIDASCPFGNFFLLPRGILREPLSVLKDADMIVLTKTNLNPDIQDIKDLIHKINPGVSVLEATHKPVGFYRIEERPDSFLETASLKENKVALLCAIADPDSFENLILSQGLNVELSFRFPDHHRYSSQDLEKIIGQANEKNIDSIITTEKDAVRLQGLLTGDRGLKILVLRIEIEIRQNEIFAQRIHSLY